MSFLKIILIWEPVKVEKKMTIVTLFHVGIIGQFHPSEDQSGKIIKSIVQYDAKIKKKEIIITHTHTHRFENL